MIPLHFLPDMGASFQIVGRDPKFGIPRQSQLEAADTLSLTARILKHWSLQYLLWGRTSSSATPPESPMSLTSPVLHSSHSDVLSDTHTHLSSPLILLFMVETLNFRIPGQASALCHSSCRGPSRVGVRWGVALMGHAPPNSDPDFSLTFCVSDHPGELIPR